jgi:hypothetical protein
MASEGSGLAPSLAGDRHRQFTFLVCWSSDANIFVVWVKAVFGLIDVVFCFTKRGRGRFP